MGRLPEDLNSPGPDGHDWNLSDLTQYDRLTFAAIFGEMNVEEDLTPTQQERFKEVQKNPPVPDNVKEARRRAAIRYIEYILLPNIRDGVIIDAAWLKVSIALFKVEQQNEFPVDLADDYKLSEEIDFLLTEFVIYKAAYAERRVATLVEKASQLFNDFWTTDTDLQQL
jgi:hypothetical protein